MVQRVGVVRLQVWCGAGPELVPCHRHDTHATLSLLRLGRSLPVALERYTACAAAPDDTWADMV